MKTGKDINFLLIEDNDLDAQILKRCLTKMGAASSIMRARDGLEGLELLREDQAKNIIPRPYVILLDINMPRMNGHEFLASLRAADDLKACQVFVLTTSDNRKDIDLAYQQNASGYIVKPNSSSELSTVLETLQAFWAVCEAPQAG